MKIITLITVALVLSSILPVPAVAGDLQADLAEARKLADSGDVAGAIALLERTTAAYAEDSEAFAYLGLYTGISAGQVQGYEEAGRLIMLSFQRLDKAVKLDENNADAWLFRGIMGVNVPGFLGRLDAGISDLERAVELYSASSSPGADKGLMTSLSTLVEGYAKKGDAASQKRTLEKIVELAPGSEAAAAAEAQLAGIGEVEEGPQFDAMVMRPKEGDSEAVLAIKGSLEKAPGAPDLLFQLGETYFEEGSYARARDALKAYTALDRKNAAAFKMLALSTARIAQKGYDENISDDTDYMSNIAFEVMANLDKAVDLAPDDLELRLTRGVFGLVMPFFLGKHDQSVADLEIVADSAAPDSMKSEAIFYLGYARQREALRYWITLAKNYPGTDGAKLALGEMRPQIEKLDDADLEKPCVKIDFVLGFQDELAPQTAIWIEDEHENYIATVYVSGFAGHVKGKQVTLPVWAAVSDFKEVDGVTSASIDVGHHIYVWDLKDYRGEKVKKGTYKVRVECSWWPTMLYQNVECLIEVGKKPSSVSVEEGDYIPFLEVTYMK